MGEEGGEQRPSAVRGMGDGPAARRGGTGGGQAADERLAMPLQPSADRGEQARDGDEDGDGERIAGRGQRPQPRQALSGGEMLQVLLDEERGPDDQQEARPQPGHLREVAGLVGRTRRGGQAAGEAPEVQHASDRGPAPGERGDGGQDDEGRPVAVGRGAERVVTGATQPVLGRKDRVVRDERPERGEREEAQALEDGTRGGAVAVHPGKIRDAAR